MTTILLLTGFLLFTWGVVAIALLIAKIIEETEEEKGDDK